MPAPPIGYGEWEAFATYIISRNLNRSLMIPMLEFKDTLIPIDHPIALPNKSFILLKEVLKGWSNGLQKTDSCYELGRKERKKSFRTLLPPQISFLPEHECKRRLSQSMESLAGAISFSPHSLFSLSLLFFFWHRGNGEKIHFAMPQCPQCSEELFF